jgi:hypothetical protein
MTNGRIVSHSSPGGNSLGASTGDGQFGQDRVDDAAERYLVIKAKGGLGNRMLSAVCGLVYAELAGRTPVIDWRDGIYAPQGTNAYPLLFRAPPMPSLEQLQRMAGVTPASWINHVELNPVDMISAYDPDKHTSPLIYRKYCVDLSRVDHPERVAVFWSYLPKFGRLRRHLRRDARFRGRAVEDIISNCIARWFHPNARVETEVSRVMDRLPRPVIGVHVRHTDMKVPLEPLKVALRRRLLSTPGATVFLATDNGQVQAEFANEFSNLYYIDKVLPNGGRRLHLPDHGFDLQREAENALVDMWTLAASDYLIHSSSSTFAGAAALIGRLRADQQDDIDHRNPHVVVKRMIQNYL